LLLNDAETVTGAVNVVVMCWTCAVTEVRQSAYVGNMPALTQYTAFPSLCAFNEAAASRVSAVER
jgi:hypothetical protein